MAERLSDDALTMVQDLANELMDGVQRGVGERAIQGALVSAALAELRTRRTAEVELHNLANKCRETERHGYYAPDTVTALLDLIDRLGEEGER